MNKLRSTRGESIAEVLVATLVVTMAMTMLAGAIVAAAHVNSHSETEKMAFQKPSSSEGTSGHVSITQNGTSISSITVNLHQTENGYYYYEK